jgi:GNAT superfamily N-acetyltransferase
MPKSNEPMSELRIRTYSESDRDGVIGLWRECGLTVWYNDPSSDIARFMRTNESTLLVGETAGRLLATAAVGHDGHRGWLYYVAVDAAAQKNGYGKAIVRAAEHWLLDKGIPKAMLMIRHSNMKADGFYRALGYYADPVAVMQRWLVPPKEAERQEAEPDVPPGKLRQIITYLEMTAPPNRPPPPQPPGRFALMRAEQPTVSFYRYLYSAVGERWFWQERKRLDDQALAAILADPKTEISVLWAGGVPAGFYELDARNEAEIELKFFGLVPEFIGRKIGPWLLGTAIESIWRRRPQPTRFWVHTCNQDHPRAVAMYQQAGFTPYAQETKLRDDPRWFGLIDPRTPLPGAATSGS